MKDEPSTVEVGSVALSEATMTDELAGGGAAAVHPETKFLDLRLLLCSIGSLFRTMGPFRLFTERVLFDPSHIPLPLKFMPLIKKSHFLA